MVGHLWNPTSGITEGGPVDVNTLKDEELLLRLRNNEDAFVERKLFSDSSDWLRTAVAFANSTPSGYPAVLFIGVKDDGTPEGKNENIEAVMKSFGKKLSKAYPRIYYLPKTLNVGGKEVLAIIIPGSEGRPHFAGPSYVRVGSESREASEKQFDSLLAWRISKASEILKWRDKNVTVDHMRVGEQVAFLGAVASSESLSVTYCNQFYVTLENKSAGYHKSIPLRRLDVSYDEKNDCLKLEVQPA
jgi:Schlafen, AlbA_2